MTTNLVPNVLEMGTWQRQRGRHSIQGLVHHATLGRKTPRSATPNGSPRPVLNPLLGRSGDSYDNAIAESINGLVQTELIRRQGPSRSLDAVELATFERVDWYNQVVLRDLFGLDLVELRKLVPVSLVDGSRTSRRAIKMSVRLACPRRIFCRICLSARNVRV
jgi:transposase InsO family protein